MKIIDSGIRALRGKEKLWIVFWGWFILWELVATILHWQFSLRDYLLDHLPNTVLWLNIVFFADIAISFMTAELQMLVIWKCATNTKKRIWFYSARIFSAILGILMLYGTVRTALHIVHLNHGNLFL